MAQNLFARRTLFTFAVFFAVGIALGYYLLRPIALWASLAAVGAGLAAIIWRALSARKQRRALRRQGGSQQGAALPLRDRGRWLRVSLLALGLGGLYLLARQQGYAQESAAWANRRLTLEGRIASVVSSGDGSSSFTMDHLSEGGTRLPGRLRVFVSHQAAESWRQGDWLRLHDVILDEPQSQRNPGGYDGRLTSWAKGALWQLSNPGHVDWMGHPDGLLQGMADLPAALRARMLGVLREGLPGDSYGALKGMLFGDVAEMDEGWLDAYRATGAAHVLAVSGLHVGIVAAALDWLCRRLFRLLAGGRKGLAGAAEAPHALELDELAAAYAQDVREDAARLAARRRDWAVFLLVLGATVFYGAMCGFRTSVIRAVLLFAMLRLAGLLGERGDGLTALGFAGLIILFINPFDLFGAGFQLSFGAVLGLMLFTRPIRSLLDRIPLKERADASKVGRFLGMLWRGIKAGASASLAAQIGIMPAQLSFFGTLPLLSVFLNLLVIPLASFAVVAGLLGGLLGSMAAPLGTLPLCLAKLALDGMNALTLTAAKIPGSTVVLGRPDALMLTAFAAGCGALLSFRKKQRRWRRGLLAAGALLCLASLGLDAFVAGHRLEMTFLDVGQGDACYVRQGKWRMLIDGGARHSWRTGSEDRAGTFSVDYGRSAVLPFLRGEGVRYLDVMLVSHGDSDHCGGLLAVLQNVDVGLLVTGPELSDEGAEETRDGEGLSAYRELLLEAERRGVPRVQLRAGDGFDLGHARVELLWPTGPTEDSNEGSLVLLLSYADGRSLFTGDAGIASEQSYAPGLGAVDVLKVSHHGSKGGSGETLLAEIRPQLSVISAGKNNRYGHPAPELLARLSAVGGDILDTAQYGAVTVYMHKDGRMRVETMKKTGK